jgi:hypothetical protein
MDKEEFHHWVFGVLRGWFSAKLGSKISDGSQLSAQFLGPPTATGTSSVIMLPKTLINSLLSHTIISC